MTRSISDLISKGWSKNPAERPKSVKFIQFFQSMLDRLDLPKEDLPMDESTVTINEYLEDLKSLFLSTQILEKGNTDEAFSLEIDGNLEVYIAVNPRLVI